MLNLRKQKISIPNELLNELYTIHWFCNCGKQDDKHFTLSQDTENLTKKAAEWERTILYFRGLVTEKLSERERSGKGKEYREWNSVVVDFRKNELPQLESVWKDKLKQYAFYSDYLISRIRFDVLALVLVYAYQELVEVPRFFDNLLNVYKSGHLPCDYNAEQNDGTITVI